ncbi:hypothetical protein KUV80_11120 [Fictibacillus nanhaiensis]|uniref:GDSL-type esterase/lipase family protein n=1 Tax=Fictibacillus nanhaiensis TaxID=742169 RepID=UPI001C970F5A|nr:GDSL-type esterase/lipase family protein [Fictibacillus nanhaiensis]MBY6037210.1 hypothetical protein [Fictibacillus nanhaiensis]
MKKSALRLFFAGAVMLAFPLNGSAEADQKNKKEIHYVALGDSLAAGQTPFGQMDMGYADYIVKKFKHSSYKVADYDNFGVPGYTSVHLKNDILYNQNVRKEISEASHITIDIGAVDLLIKLKTDPIHAPDAIASVSMNLQTILSTIDQLNPDVDVFIMGYYNPFPYYPQQEQAKLEPLLTALNNQIEYRAGTNGDHYVGTKEKIANNYLEYLPNPQDIHLSLSGYKVVANQFWKEIKIQLIMDIIKDYDLERK